MLDAFDLRIAQRLQRDATEPLARIAAEVGLSPSATHRRIAKLRKAGAIRSQVCVLDPKAFGVAMTFIVGIALEKVRVAEVAALKTRLKAAAEVQQVYNVTGEVDLLLVVLARSVEDFERISRRLFSADPKIRRYTTSVVMDRVKVGLTVPVGA